MASTVSEPVTARIAKSKAAAFRRQAARYGLTPSSAIAALVEAALAVENADIAAGHGEHLTTETA
jgi:hypothetical protein